MKASITVYQERENLMTEIVSILRFLLLAMEQPDEVNVDFSSISEEYFKRNICHESKNRKIFNHFQMEP